MMDSAPPMDTCVYSRQIKLKACGEKSSHTRTVDPTYNITCSVVSLPLSLSFLPTAGSPPPSLKRSWKGPFRDPIPPSLKPIITSPPSFSSSCSSSPPIFEIGREDKLDLEGKSWAEYDGDSQAEFVKRTEPNVIFSTVEVLPELATPIHKINQQPSRPISVEGDVQVPNLQTNFADQIPPYNTSVQGAWQTFVAYDACFRLCLYAWARNCLEAPEFLRDECVVIRNAFGLQKFLLQPRGQIHEEGSEVENVEGVSTVKGRKMIGQVEVEVKRIRIISQRKKLHDTSSQRALQLGAQYVRHVSTMVKNQISSLTATSCPDAPEEIMSCLLHLKSSIQDAPETGSLIYVKPGTGDSHVFYPESLGDALLVEVQNNDKVNQGRATIQMSSLTDSNGEMIKWWPLYLEEHGCVGKVQLFISISGTSENIGAAKAGPAVETLIYDLVLEATLRAQHFHRKNLPINGIWKWLLDEFDDYYGVYDAYAKLRMSPKYYVVRRGRKCGIFRSREECKEQVTGFSGVAFKSFKSRDEAEEWLKSVAYLERKGNLVLKRRSWGSLKYL